MATTTRSHPLPRRGEKFTWKLFHYVRPNSLTWWAGLLAMLTGIASLALPTTGPLSELSRLVALLAGSGEPRPRGSCSSVWA